VQQRWGAAFTAHEHPRPAPSKLIGLAGSGELFLQIAFQSYSCDCRIGLAQPITGSVGRFGQVLQQVYL
jgi:hypothetical protein